MRQSIVIRCEGSAGDGILALGKILARVAARAGYGVVTHSSFLAEVRGGQSSLQLKIGLGDVLSPGDAPELLIALNAQGVEEVAPQLADGGLALGPLGVALEPTVAARVNATALDFDDLATAATGSARSRNAVAVGAAAALLDLDAELTDQVVTEALGKRDPETGRLNALACARGRQAMIAAGKPAGWSLRPSGSPGKLLLSGNQAVALGAVAAGVRFYAGYPITPATEIMEELADLLPRVGGRMLQAEDEIASLAMCIGASFGGIKAMTATSGPGLSLMAELVGLSGMAETPVVIVDVQRGGPSTGMPTKDGQADLDLAVYGTHGEIPRAVLAAQTVADCFTQTVAAVNLAQEYQVPVLLLTSQSLSHSLQTVELPDLASLPVYEETFFSDLPAEGPYLRYRPTADGRPSLRARPGTPGGTHRTGGLEHDDRGRPSFGAERRREMVRRRQARVEALSRAADAATDPSTVTHGAHPVGVVSWGRSAAIAREVVDELRATGLDLGSFFPHRVWPLPAATVRAFLASGLRRLVVCEANATQQFANLLRSRFARELQLARIEVVTVNKDDGNPFDPAELRAALLPLLADLPGDDANLAATSGQAPTRP